MKPLRFLFVVLFALSSAVALSSAAPLPTAYANTHVPAGLSTAAWAAIQTFLPSTYLKASNTEAEDEFGHTVAIDGDTVVVGARLEASNATGANGNQANNAADRAGAVYVFTHTNGVWSQQAYLKASNTDGSDEFGYAVAIDGDTIVVGAYKEASNATEVNGNQADNSAGSAGAAYVFTRTAGVWSQQAYLKASNAQAVDLFGYAVDIEGDTIVVGAPLEDSQATAVNGNQSDNSALNAGAAYVFTRTGGVWSQQAYLKAANAEAGDFFGEQVAISGDTVVVGVYQEDSQATGVNGDQANNLAPDSGAAYVFARTSGVWSQQAYLKASNAEEDDWFGWSVDIDGDLIAVGAVREASQATGVDGDQTDNSASSSGAVYMFSRTAGVWSQQAYIKASNTGPADDFGHAVALAGNTLVVGALFEDSHATGVNGDQTDDSASGAGAAYVFSHTAGVWSQQAYLKASNTEEADFFGAAVAVDDGTVLVGTWREASNATGVNGDQTDNSALRAGAVYLFAPAELALVVQRVGQGQVVSAPAGIECGVVCTADFAPNTVITLTATAEAGYTFLHWAEGEDVVSTAASYSFTATAERTLTAHFAADAPKIYLPLVVR